MNANQTHTSYAELNAILDQARRPSDLPVPVTDAQLRALQQRWNAMLSARLDETLENAGPGPLVDAVAETWRRLAAEQPVLRAVLDAGSRRQPVFGAATDTESRMLAHTAGLVGLNEPEADAVRVGEAFRERIRGAATLLAYPHRRAA
ncbi:MAG: hypothetical protein JO100_08610 [Pseudonocardia sp.]|nr:hypothetical protein [Pseudonocardia sp.]